MACDHLQDEFSRGPDGECLLCQRERAMGAPAPAIFVPAADQPVDLLVPGTAGDAPAVLVEWLAQPGEQLAPGTPILVLERAGISETLRAPVGGTMGIHRARAGASVPPGFAVAKILPRDPAAIAVEAAPLVPPVPVADDDPAGLDANAGAIAEPSMALPESEPEPALGETRQPPAGHTPIVPADAGMPEAAADIWADVQVEPAAEAAAASDPEAEASPDKAKAEDQDTQAGQAGADANSPSPEPEAPSAGHETPDAEQPDPAAASGALILSEDERIFEELKSLQERGIFVVTLIGSFEGGKTWFLQRLKHELHNRRGIWVDPPPPIEGEEVRRTNNFSVHMIRARSPFGGETEQFAIVDLPGETVRRLVEDPGRAPRSLLAAMNAAGAMIVALPADEVLLGGYANQVLQILESPDDALERHERRRKSQFVRKMAEPDYANRLRELAEADAFLTNLTGRLCKVTAMLSTMRANGMALTADARQPLVTNDMVEAHVRSGRFAPFRTPTFIALTKADRIADLDAVGRDLLGKDQAAATEAMLDPRQLVMEHRHALPAVLDHWFEHHKFDFVAAFEGHNGDTRIRYNRYRCRGIMGVIDWISWVRRTNPSGALHMRALKWAQTMRHWRDGGGIDRGLGGIGDGVPK